MVWPATWPTEGQPTGRAGTEGLCVWESGSNRSAGLRTEKAESKPSAGSSKARLSSLILALCILWLHLSLPSHSRPLCSARNGLSRPRGEVETARGHTPNALSIAGDTAQGLQQEVSGGQSGRGEIV